LAFLEISVKFATNVTLLLLSEELIYIGLSTLRNVRFMQLHYLSEFASTNFMHRACSFLAICNEIRAQIWGIEGLIHPPKTEVICVYFV